MSMELLALINHLARERGRESLQHTHAEIVSFDGNAGTVVIEFKPHGIQVPDVPLYTPYAGNSKSSGSGIQFGPAVGSQVIVVAFDAEWEELAAYTQGWGKNTPPGILSDEMVMIHKDGSYVKMLNDKNLELGSKQVIKATAPTFEISDGLGALAAGDALVRKADLQVLVDWVNHTLVPWLTTAPYLGNLGAPAVPNPATLAGFVATPAPAATASSVGKAKG